MLTCKHPNSIINLISARIVFNVVQSFQIFVTFRVNNYIFKVESGSSRGTIKDNFTNGFGEEEIELFIIFLNKLRIDWLSYKYFYTF